MRRTRIVCTLGPASSSSAVVRQMVAAGMDVARFNFSHGDADSHRRAAGTVREAALPLGRHVALLQDLQGPKIRTGRLSEPFVRLSRGRRLTLTAEPVTGSVQRVSVSHPEILAALRPRDRVLLADGQIELRVEATEGSETRCAIIRGGLLGERKGISVPGRGLELPALTEKDHSDLRVGAEIGMDYIALSFVRSPADVIACRQALDALGLKTPIIAKLERAEALRNLTAILACVEGVMVARGDLGVELPLGALPPAQKDIIERANRSGAPVITATEMLESMVTSNRPTRAEASDVANAIWDGTDAVMLSQETSIGAHPVEAVRAMARICLAAEGHPSYQRTPAAWQVTSIGGAMSQAAASIAVELKARAIVAFTESGTTARRVSKARPSTPIIGASPHPEILRRTALYAGVRPLLVPQGEDTDDMIAKATDAAVAAGLVKRGDRLVFVAGVPVGQAGVTNLVKVEVVG
ncbi:MAG: pyruvate kinase [Candidatus Dormibacteraeota bacterium]|nr:pyruvate kinase [Candidatus Dormibacteraeota bacterium]